ncbi:MAG: HEAT repeat domain-containing protein [Planctomycetes bacterium]|nr:HEAT repeat domain-containing protein [Planctomycetota bacterium]
MLALLLALALHPHPTWTGSQSAGPRLSWRSPKELAPLRDPELTHAACKPIVADLAKRAKQRSECVELAQEFLGIAVSTDHVHAIDSELMDAVHGCDSPGVRTFLLRELEASASSEKSALILLAAMGWGDDRFATVVLREYLKDPRGFAWGWGDWFLAQERYGAAMPKILARIADPKETDAGILRDLMRGARELCRGTGKHTEWAAAMRKLALDPRDGLRRQVHAYLYEHLGSSDLPMLLEASKHADWSTRRAALDGLAALRSAGAVEALVAMLAREEPNSRIGAGGARSLTRLCRRSFARDAAAWKLWWDSEGKKGFVPAGKDETPPPHGLSDSTLFGTMVSSSRVLVVLDLDDLVRSTSTDPTVPERIASVRRALEEYLRSLHESSRWNVLVGRANPVAWKPSLSAPAQEANGEKPGVRAAAARKALEDLPPRELELELLRRFLDDELGPNVPVEGGEHKPVWSMLRAAWEQTEADTILLVSDGLRLVPEGDMKDEKDDHEKRLRESAESLDDFRRVRVHTFSLGADAPRLRQLAEGQLGEYRTVP